MATIQDMIRKLEHFGHELQNLSGKKFTILPDQDGMIDRQCPREECKALFKVNDTDWEKVSDIAYCPSCGNKFDKGDFLTDEHRQKAKECVHQSLLNNWHNNTTIPNNLVNLESDLNGLNQRGCNNCQSTFALAENPQYCPCCGNRQ